MSVLKQSIAASIAHHVKEQSLKELHLSFMAASRGKQRCIILSLLHVLFYVTEEDKASGKLGICILRLPFPDKVPSQR